MNFELREALEKFRDDIAQRECDRDIQLRVGRDEFIDMLTVFRANPAKVTDDYSGPSAAVDTSPLRLQFANATAVVVDAFPSRGMPFGTTAVFVQVFPGAAGGWFAGTTNDPGTPPQIPHAGTSREGALANLLAVLPAILIRDAE